MVKGHLRSPSRNWGAQAAQQMSNKSGRTPAKMVTFPWSFCCALPSLDKIKVALAAVTVRPLVNPHLVKTSAAVQQAMQQCIDQHTPVIDASCTR